MKAMKSKPIFLDEKEIERITKHFSETPKK